MSEWKIEEKKSNVWEPTTKEVEALRSELKKFPQKKIGSRLVSPFDQYLMSLKVIRLDENGHIWVKDPMGHTRLSKVNAKLEWKEHYEQERLYGQFPGEKKAFLDKYFTLKKTAKRAACSECNCLLDRDYVCRHNCKHCLDSNPVTA